MQLLLVVSTPLTPLFSEYIVYLSFMFCVQELVMRCRFQVGRKQRLSSLQGVQVVRSVTHIKLGKPSVAQGEVCSH